MIQRIRQYIVENKKLVIFGILVVIFSFSMLGSSSETSQIPRIVLFILPVVVSNIIGALPILFIRPFSFFTIVSQSLSEFGFLIRGDFEVIFSFILILFFLSYAFYTKWKRTSNKRFLILFWVLGMVATLLFLLNSPLEMILSVFIVLANYPVVFIISTIAIFGVVRMGTTVPWWKIFLAIILVVGLIILLFFSWSAITFLLFLAFCRGSGCTL